MDYTRGLKQRKGADIHIPGTDGAQSMTAQEETRVTGDLFFPRASYQVGWMFADHLDINARAAIGALVSSGEVGMGLPLGDRNVLQFGLGITPGVSVYAGPVRIFAEVPVMLGIGSYNMHSQEEIDQDPTLKGATLNAGIQAVGVNLGFEIGL